jgi:hypothetical protein
MTFNPSVPVSGQAPNAFPSQNQTNMTRLQALINADHQFNNSMQSDDGYHKVAHWNTQTGVLGDNTPTPIAAVGQLYTKSVPITGVNGFTTEHQMYHQGTGGNNANEMALSILPVRAFISFNGVTLAVNQAYNCNTPTYSGGVYTLTFPNALPSNFYTPLMSAGRQDGSFTQMCCQPAPSAYNTVFTTTTFKFSVNAGGNVAVQANIINVVILGG